MTNISDDRFKHALTAFLRQEVQAPAIAITELLDMIIEDARRLAINVLLPDLERMHRASIQLNAFVKSITSDLSGESQNNQSSEAFYKGLRHDLRTPLNAIIGYSELIIEDMRSADGTTIEADLIKIRDSAKQLLGQIDAMVALAHRSAEDIDKYSNFSDQISVVSEILRAVTPLQSAAARKATQESYILVIDDNPSNRDVLQRRLTREGHSVSTAVSGASGLELLGRRNFDLILLDLMMPGMSGFEVLRRLKESPRTKEIPVIVISALDEIDSVVRCIEAGAEDYLSRPFNPVLLQARVEASLERKRFRDREKQFISDLEREKQYSETLLLNILPQGIVNRIRKGETIIADGFSEATILFCDLVGFTTISQSLPAERVVDLLRKIFANFDRLTTEHRVEKIKTIGDSYMAAAGVPEPQMDHATRIAELALRMLESVREITEEIDLKIEARIGIHSGPIVAGIIGTHKFAYDIWGDTVNTASRMESYSLPGRIQVSPATRSLLGNSFAFEPRGAVEVKGIGMTETFFLTRSSVPQQAR